MEANSAKGAQFHLYVNICPRDFFDFFFSWRWAKLWTTEIKILLDIRFLFMDEILHIMAQIVYLEEL